MAAAVACGCRVAGAHERWLQWQHFSLLERTAAAREAALVRQCCSTNATPRSCETCEDDGGSELAAMPLTVCGDTEV